MIAGMYYTYKYTQVYFGLLFLHLSKSSNNTLCFLSVCRMEKLLNQWLWSQEFWLPPTITWHDIAEGTMEGSRHPLPRDLLVALPLALGFITVRFAFERSVVAGMDVFRKENISDYLVVVGLCDWTFIQLMFSQWSGV